MQNCECQRTAQDFLAQPLATNSSHKKEWTTKLMEKRKSKLACRRGLIQP